jgi:K+-sensing histidine kinase KdpD
MLDIASSNDARLEVSLTGFKLSELLEKVTQKTLYSIYNKDIIIEYTSGNYDFELFGDRDLIERALINVVDNAVKYSPVNGKISIISLSENNKLTIRILDQGPGVKEEEKNEIFKLFYSSAKQPNIQKSSGIGLAFCKMVVEAHNGTIRLNSPEDGGSEVIFTLPVVKSKTETASNNSHLVNKKYSEELRSEINNILPKLRQLNYYQTSEIYSLVSSINCNSNEKKCELEEIMTKALSCNPRFYADLIKELS